MVSMVRQELPRVFEPVALCQTPRGAQFVKSRILTSAPSGLPDSYVHVTPGWLVAAGRVGMGSLGVVAGVAVWRGHGTLGPLMASVSAIVATVLVLIALWSPAWDRRIKFVANEQGIAFPANDLLVPVPPRAKDTRWLLVPWSSIHDIRLARKDSESGFALAFDLEVSPEEARDFFRHVASPTDRRESMASRHPAAYGDFPPSPRRAVAILLSLKASSPTT